MTNPMLIFSSVFQSVYAMVCPTNRDRTRRSDRGAVSIEQVLWYAAAAVSVAVVAAIIWSQIKSTASTGVNTPSAP